MEKSKTLNSTKETINNLNGDWGGGGCSFWIFGDEKSADNDLKDKFDIVEDEKKD